MRSHTESPSDPETTMFNRWLAFIQRFLADLIFVMVFFALQVAIVTYTTGIDQTILLIISVMVEFGVLGYREITRNFKND